MLTFLVFPIYLVDTHWVSWVLNINKYIINVINIF
jgi:hypothetical protein